MQLRFGGVQNHDLLVGLKDMHDAYCIDLWNSSNSVLDLDQHTFSFENYYRKPVEGQRIHWEDNIEKSRAVIDSLSDTRPNRSILSKTLLMGDSMRSMRQPLVTEPAESDERKTEHEGFQIIEHPETERNNTHDQQSKSQSKRSLKNQAPQDQEEGKGKELGTSSQFQTLKQEVKSVVDDAKLKENSSSKVKGLQGDKKELDKDKPISRHKSNKGQEDGKNEYLPLTSKDDMNLQNDSSF